MSTKKKPAAKPAKVQKPPEDQVDPDQGARQKVDPVLEEKIKPEQPAPAVNPGLLVKGKAVQYQLAALMYYATIPAGVTVKSFETLACHEAQVFMQSAGEALLMIDKMGKMLVDKNDPRLSMDLRLQRKEHLERVIIGFMKELNVKKSGKHGEKQKLINPLFFPAGELAWKIIDTPDGR